MLLPFSLQTLGLSAAAAGLTAARTSAAAGSFYFCECKENAVVFITVVGAVCELQQKQLWWLYQTGI